jgi:hypothetical protein
MADGPLSRILVWAYCHTDAYHFESLDWYPPESFAILRSSVAQIVNDHLSELYADLSEWFNLADFPDVLDQFIPSETPLFLSAAGAPIDTDVSSVEDYDCFSGLCAVIRHRIKQESLEQVKSAAELFNWTIDFGLLTSETGASSVIKVGSVEEVAPSLLDRLLQRLTAPPRCRPESFEESLSQPERRLLVLRPMLIMLAETVQSEHWAENQLAVRILSWVAETYKVLLESEYGE